MRSITITKNALRNLERTQALYVNLCDIAQRGTRDRAARGLRFDPVSKYVLKEKGPAGWLCDVYVMYRHSTEDVAMATAVYIQQQRAQRSRLVVFR